MAKLGKGDTKAMKRAPWPPAKLMAKIRPEPDEDAMDETEEEGPEPTEDEE